MSRILITGMSGTGKSSVLDELRTRGFETVETDVDDWCEWGTLAADTEAGWLWREDRLRELLEQPRTGPLFVSGCVANQGHLYGLFDHVVLLSAPADVILERVQARTTNPYGQTPEQQAEILGHLESVEPLLRRGAELELDSSRMTVKELADALVRMNVR